MSGSLDLSSLFSAEAQGATLSGLTPSPYATPDNPGIIELERLSGMPYAPPGSPIPGAPSTLGADFSTETITPGGATDPYGPLVPSAAGSPYTAPDLSGDTTPLGSPFGLGPQGSSAGGSGGYPSGTGGSVLSNPLGALGGGTLTYIEELAIRIMLVLVGMVLIAGGFYVAGSRGAGAASITQLAKALK